MGDTNPVSDSVEAEQRLRAILSEPRIDEASQLRFETANLVAIYLYWFGIEFPQDRPHAVAWALVRSGGSKIEPLAEALFSTLSWEDKSLAETLFMQLDLVLPGGAPRWHPPHANGLHQLLIFASCITRSPNQATFAETMRWVDQAFNWRTAGYSRCDTSFNF
ncbi:MAG: hypothetical protein LR015_00460 [Verrucomicrobia bacterium]|nr:hypothetical protein [Verrucomicrobiota bacterium]